MPAKVSDVLQREKENRTKMLAAFFTLAEQKKILRKRAGRFQSVTFNVPAV